MASETAAATIYACDCEQNLRIPLDTAIYLVTNHDGEVCRVRYCDSCADLAACDWNGETANIKREGQ